jgi:hypothetical protein
VAARSPYVERGRNVVTLATLRTPWPLPGSERERFLALIKAKGLAWVAQELHVHAGDVEDATRGDDVEEVLADDARRLLTRTTM